MPVAFRWMMNAIYLLLLALALPLLIYRRIAKGKYRHGWREKLTGSLQRRYPDRLCIWLHAVSVGEVLQLQKVVEEMQLRFPTAELFISVTTDTGYEVARNKYPQHTISYFPLDFSWAVGKALSTIRPDLIVLVELELWPNFILTARHRGIPLALINGRMGAKSYRGYSRLKPLMRKLFSCFEILCVQNETYADRLRNLGSPIECLIVTGNIKFDRVESDRGNAKTQELRTAFKLTQSNKILIAGSTQDPEESYAINTWKRLVVDFPDLRLIVVPRHKERFEEVASLIVQCGCPLHRRSEQVKILAQKSEDCPRVDDRTLEPAVLLLDTLGELAACWGLADIAFVGGSLTSRGGQNMIEPAGYGAAVLFGPNTWNFKDVTEALLSQNAARVVNGPDQLRETVDALLRDPDEAHRLGEAARSFVATQQGATKRTVDLLERILKKTSKKH